MSDEYPQLLAFAKANERLVELFRWLDAQDDVVQSRRGMDARNYADAAVVEQFVEGDFLNGDTICYWLETRLEEKICSVEADVFLQLRDGQHTLHSLSAAVDKPADLPGALQGMAEELWRSRQEQLENAIAISAGRMQGS